MVCARADRKICVWNLLQGLAKLSVLGPAWKRCLTAQKLLLIVILTFWHESIGCCKIFLQHVPKVRRLGDALLQICTSSASQLQNRFRWSLPTYNKQEIISLLRSQSWPEILEYVAVPYWPDYCNLPARPIDPDPTEWQKKHGTSTDRSPLVRGTVHAPCVCVVLVGRPFTSRGFIASEQRRA